MRSVPGIAQGLDLDLERQHRDMLFLLGRMHLSGLPQQHDNLPAVQNTQQIWMWEQLARALVQIEYSVPGMRILNLRAASIRD